MSKMIEFEVLCRECRHKYIKIGKYNCTHKDNKSKEANPADCPIWKSLTDFVLDIPHCQFCDCEEEERMEPEKKKTLQCIDGQPTWLEYEGY